MSTDVATRRVGGRFHTRLMAALALALLAAALVPLVGAQAVESQAQADSSGDSKLLFFTSDGMRQDQIAKYANQGLLPGYRDMLRNGVSASDNGLLTQAPPNT